MPVVTLEPAERALLEIDARRFVLVTPEPGVSLLVNAVCPHRGGPLHLGQLDDDATAIHCPWHSRKVSLRVLQREALPLVRWRDRAVAVVPEADAADAADAAGEAGEADAPEASAARAARAPAAPAAPRTRRCAELCRRP